MRTTMLDTEPLTPGICEWCGKITELENVACSLTCEAQLRRLEAQQGRDVLRALKRWRKFRGRKGTPGEGAMTEVAVVIDRFLQGDRRRREEMQAAARAEAARQAQKEADKKTAKAKPRPPQSAAPVTDRPDEQEEPK